MPTKTIPKELKERLLSAKKRAAFSRGIYNTAFVSAEEALPSVLSSLGGLKQILVDAPDIITAKSSEMLDAELVRITDLHEKYVRGISSGFAKKDLSKTIRMIHLLIVEMEKNRLRLFASRRERILHKTLQGLIASGFVMLFGLVAVGLAMGLAYPGYNQGLTGNYFSKPQFNGARFQNVDHRIDFYWHDEAPMKAMPINNFSIRWEGCVNVDDKNGKYIAASADDDVVVIVDGQTIIDTRDSKNYATVFSKNKIPSGVHPIEVQYREKGGSAHISLGWASDKVRQTVIPANRLIPRNLVIGGQGTNPDCPAMPAIKPLKK
jgi:hypothetical protein